jgi:O-antigen/teichoic acid export membrane protein
MVLLAAGVFMISGGLTAPAVTGIHIIALGIVLGGAVVYFRRFSRTIVLSGPKSYHTREWLSVALPAMLIEIMALMLSQTDIIMVGFFRGSRDVGLFAAATKVASLVTFCLSSANIVLAPTISRMFARGEMADLQRMVCMVCRIMVIVASIITLALIFGGGRIMSLFGPDFTVASKVLVILSLAQLANALTGPSGYLMTMTGHQYAMAHMVAGVILFKIILNFIFIPLWGIEGAAFATTVTTIILNILLVIVVRKLLGIRISIFARC